MKETKRNKSRLVCTLNNTILIHFGPKFSLPQDALNMPEYRFSQNLRFFPYTGKNCSEETGFLVYLTHTVRVLGGIKQNGILVQN